MARVLKNCIWESSRDGGAGACLGGGAGKTLLRKRLFFLRGEEEFITLKRQRERFPGCGGCEDSKTGINLDSWRNSRRIGQGAGRSSEREAGARSRCALRAKFRILRAYH